MHILVDTSGGLIRGPVPLPQQRVLMSAKSYTHICEQGIDEITINACDGNSIPFSKIRSQFTRSVQKLTLAIIFSNIE